MGPQPPGCSPVLVHSGLGCTRADTGTRRGSTSNWFCHPSLSGWLQSILAGDTPHVFWILSISHVLLKSFSCQSIAHPAGEVRQHYRVASPTFQPTCSSHTPCHSPVYKALQTQVGPWPLMEKKGARGREGAASKPKHRNGWPSSQVGDWPFAGEKVEESQLRGVQPAVQRLGDAIPTSLSWEKALLSLMELTSEKTYGSPVWRLLLKM